MNTKLRQALEDLASEYGLMLFEEPGFMGPVYYLMNIKEAHEYLLANWHPDRARVH